MQNGSYMKLSTVERELLARIELQAPPSAAEVASQLKVHTHRAQYAMRSLRGKGVELRPFVDVFRCGLLDGAIFFSLASKAPRARESLLQYLEKRKGIAWLCSLSGEFQYGVVLQAPQLTDFHELLGEIEARADGGVTEKAFAFRMAYRQFPRKFLSPAARFAPALRMEAGKERLALSEIDRETLRALVDHPNASLRDISKELGVALSTLQYRVKSLEDRKIIAGWWHFIPAALLDVQSYKVLCISRRRRPTPSKGSLLSPPRTLGWSIACRRSATGISSWGSNANSRRRLQM